MSGSETSARPLTLLAPLAGHVTKADEVQREVLQLFDEFAPGLRRYVRACGLPSGDAEDVVQDAFLALFKHLQREGSRENLRGWLVQVSYRGALKHRERLARRQRRENVWAAESMERAADSTVDPEGHAVLTQRRLRLHEVIRTLSPREQTCLHLRAEGLSYREIAQALGVSLGTVAKSVARVVRRLTAEEGK